MSVTETVAELCSAAIEKLGFDLFETTYKKEADGMNLTLYIESQSGEPVTLEDCEKVSTAVESILDKEPLDGQPYLLNVSSLGLDRPIKTEKDLLRSKNKMIEIKLYSKQDGQKEFTGTLADWTDETLTLTVRVKKEEVQKVFNRKEIANICPHLEF